MREQMAHLVQKAKTDPLVPQVILEMLDRLALKEIRVHPVHRGPEEI